MMEHPVKTALATASVDLLAVNGEVSRLLQEREQLAQRASDGDTKNAVLTAQRDDEQRKRVSLQKENVELRALLEEVSKERDLARRDAEAARNKASSDLHVLKSNDKAAWAALEMRKQDLQDRTNADLDGKTLAEAVDFLFSRLNAERYEGLRTAQDAIDQERKRFSNLAATVECAHVALRLHDVSFPGDAPIDTACLLANQMIREGRDVVARLTAKPRVDAPLDTSADAIIDQIIRVAAQKHALHNLCSAETTRTLLADEGSMIHALIFGVASALAER